MVDSRSPIEYRQKGRESDAPEYNGSSVMYAFQRAHAETNAGASLKPDTVVHRVNGLEEVRWTRNSSWPRYFNLAGSKSSCKSFV